MQAKRPVLYVGGGCLDAAPELRAFVERTGIPVAQTLMGLGASPQRRSSYALFRVSVYLPMLPKRLV